MSLAPFVSFAICTHNEGSYIEQLISSLLSIPPTESFEIVIVDDYSTDSETKDILEKYIHNSSMVRIFQNHLNKNFAAQKNFLASKCNGKWIINIDADELLSEYLLRHIFEILRDNSTIDAFALPRVNIVNGLPFNVIHSWGWNSTILPNLTPMMLDMSRVTNKDYITYLHTLPNCILKIEDDIVYFIPPAFQWPDYQMRIYKNDKSIKWKNAVHEQLTGFKTFCNFPAQVEYAIIHDKTAARQIQQNTFYSTIERR